MAGMPDAAFQRLLAIVKCEDVARVKVGLHREAMVDADDLVLVSPYRWMSNGRYAYAKTPDGVVLMHRLIAGVDGMMVDHIDGDGLNNQRHNLRPCTHTQNMQNRCSVSGASRFKGVWVEGDRWRSAIRVAGKKMHLGSFTSEIDAARSYDKAAVRLFGEFAKTNQDLGLFQLPPGLPKARQ